MTALNSPVDVPTGVVLNQAHVIHNMGRVVVYASAAPEPASYATMLAGLAVINVMTQHGLEC